MNVSKGTLIGIVVLIFLFAFAGTAKRLILGGTQSVVALPAAQPLSGAVSQSMETSSSAALPAVGKDYSLSVQYFDNNAWAVGIITPIKQSFDGGVVVLERQNGVYRVVLAPSSEFSSTQLQSLPSDVAAYIRTKAGVN